ncbi:fungal-specific transcription factor domain-containing protein [Aspergillus californicus]
MDQLLHPPPWRACNACHRKKTKCDMQRPRCGLCIRTGSICDFPLKRKPPSKAGHVRAQRRRTSSTTPSEQTLGASSNNHGLTNPTSCSLRRTPAADDAPNPFMIPRFPLSLWSLDAGMDFPSAGVSQFNGAQLPELPFISPLPSSVVDDLVDVFFDRVQPVLPLLHKPDFTAFSRGILGGPQLYREDLKPDTALLLYAMCALSARFSTHPTLAAIAPLERGDVYCQYARLAYQDTREILEPTLQYLQGCILLAFYFYSSGLSSQGWILVGVCVRIAYDLELSSVDDGDSDLDWHEKELRRRAWWLVCELDAFGSIMMRRPFAIDRRHRVHLPICDEDWFAGKQVRSAPVILEPGKCWLSLHSCPNQSERAWYLVANFLFSLTNDQSYTTNRMSVEDILALQNDIACTRMSLPPSFQHFPNADLTLSQQNWIVGTEIMLTVSDLLAAKLAVRSASNQPTLDRTVLDPRPEAMCISRLSAILRKWSLECISAAHPFLACAISPSRIHVASPAEPDVGLSSFSDLAGLVQGIFAAHWPLGSIASSLRVIVMKDTPLNKEEAQLAKRYPVFFTTFPRSTQSNTREEHQQESESASDSRNTDNAHSFCSPFSSIGLDQIFGIEEPNATFPV